MPSPQVPRQFPHFASVLFGQSVLYLEHKIPHLLSSQALLPVSTFASRRKKRELLDNWTISLQPDLDPSRFRMTRRLEAKNPMQL